MQSFQSFLHELCRPDDRLGLGRNNLPCLDLNTTLPLQVKIHDMNISTELRLSLLGWLGNLLFTGILFFLGRFPV